MSAPVSKLMSKARTVISKAVRAKLGWRPGDLPRHVFESGRVVIERTRTEESDPFATFTEWASEADEEAYRSL
jgi:antitoxin PrlF